MGFGSIGRRHFRNLRDLGKSNFIFCRTGQSSIDDSEISEYPVFRNLSEALLLEPLATIVCNPSSLHLPVALQAAGAGSHLFVEKPLSNTLDRCADLEAIVARKGLTAMVGCQHRFHPLLQSVREHIENGALGRITTVDAEYAEYLPGWHEWEDYRNSYSAREDLGGGVILTLIHPLDYLYWLFGRVGKVSARTKKLAELKTQIEDDVADITMDFDSGVIASVHLDYIRQPAVHFLEINGDRGALRLDFLAGTLQINLQGAQPINETVERGFDRNSMFVAEMKHFLSSIDTGDEVRVPLKDGIEVLKIALEAKRSSRAGSQ